MRRILAIFGVAVLALLVLPAAPAGAISYTPNACAFKSGGGLNPYSITVCAKYGWRMQNDGTGVHTENVRIFTSGGCGDLESKAFDSIVVDELYTPNAQGIGDQYGCDVTWDLELNGPDTGSSLLKTQVSVNVDGNTDFVVNLYCEIKPNQPDDCAGEVA